MGNPLKRALDRLLYGPPGERFQSRATAPEAQNPPLNIFTKKAGMLVTHETALQIAAVFACVRWLAEAIGMLPWSVYLKAGNGVKTEYLQSPLWPLLHTRPNPEMGPMTFKETLTGHALTWGNGYAEIERNAAGWPAALWPITPDRVVPGRDDQGRVVYEVNNGSGMAKTVLPADDVFHLHGLGYDGLCGYSVITMAARSMGTGLASDAFQNSFFANNTVLGGVLRHPKAISDQAYDRLKESWQNRHKGPQAAYKPAILEEGMDWQSIGMPLKDAEFIASRKFTVAEICRWFKVPPHKVADLERATFSNIEHQSIEAVVDCILPWCVRLEEEANYKLVGMRNHGRVFTKLNLRGLLRGDSETRAKYYQIMRNLGAFSVDDILALEDMNPIGGTEGGMRVMQGQYMTLEAISNQTAQPQPQPAPGGAAG